LSYPATTSQGETVEEALANLQEATELYLEEFPFEGQARCVSTTLGKTRVTIRLDNEVID
jgi:uncharacterized protein (DUF4415 family)